MRYDPLQAKKLKYKLMTCVALAAIISDTMLPVSAVAAESNTASPIKHVIVIIGENRTFDHIFATYQPVNKNEQVLNLLSEKIVNADGTPGPNYAKALQYQGFDTTKYEINPPQNALCDLAARADRRSVDPVCVSGARDHHRHLLREPRPRGGCAGRRKRPGAAIITSIC